MSGEWGVATTPLNCLEPSDAGAYGVPTNKTTANAVGAHCKAPTLVSGATQFQQILILLGIGTTPDP